MKVILTCLIFLSIISCGGKADRDKKVAIISPLPTTNNSDGLNIPDGFDYQMNRDINFSFQVLDHNGSPGYFIGIRIYETTDHKMSSINESEPSIAPHPILIYSGQTDVLGYFAETIRLPMHLKSVQVQASQLGINNSIILEIRTDNIFHQFN